MNLIELPFDPHHLWVPSGAPKTISMPMVQPAQTNTYLMLRLTLSSNGPKRASTWPMSPRSSIGCVKNNFRAYCTFSANYAPILREDQHYLQTSFPFDLHHLGGPSCAALKISVPVVHSRQTMHLSVAVINTMSKWTEASFQLTHVT
jgi:hypothetical protein